MKSAITINIKVIRSLFYICFSTFLLLVNTISLHGQQNPDRPSLGLVLSGGGAHGIAHLGVIKVMEEEGLYPDYIAGTSMGSIIGGLYASGYSSDSLHKLLKSINWDDMLSNRLQENRIIFPEKARAYNSIISLSISEKKVNIPSGLNNGQLIENSLSYYLWPVSDIGDFSKLPIPFMCNATDIVTYSKFNFHNGYLPDAIRASFTVPSIFTPLRIDTLLLVDGGLIRNFPASEAKAMGADLLIGSYVGFEKNSPEKLQTLPGIIGQIAMFRSLEDFNEEKKFVRILVKPSVDRFSVAGFSNVDSLVNAGYIAANPFRSDFRMLADSLNKMGKMRQHARLPESTPIAFDKVEVHGNMHYSDDIIKGVLDIEPGDAVTRDDMTEKIELLYGKAWFEKIKYRIVHRNDSVILAIECEESPRAMLYGSVHYDNSLESGLIVGTTLTNLVLNRSVIDFNSFLGKYYRIKLGILQYLDRNQKFGVSLGYSADNTLFPWLLHNKETGNTFSRNQYFEIGLNQFAGLNNLITFSAAYNETNLRPDFISINNIRNYTYDYYSSELSFSRNTLNSKYFPDKGLVLNVSGRMSELRYAASFIENTEYPLSYAEAYKPEYFYTLRAGLKQYVPAGEKVTFAFGGEALYISDTDTLSSQNNFYLLGGIQQDTRRSIPMAGFNPGEIKVNRMAILRTEMDIEFLKDLHLNLAADIAMMEDNFFPYEMLLVSGYSLGLGYNSIIGPVKAGIMYGSYPGDLHTGNFRTYISIGYNF
ncbi:MAG TPA: patatin-like phospholipase family protein [Bacteroidales bacterium]|nr:patatin-like phospholipase family protein [Bacteroidales bacterium]